MITSKVYYVIDNYEINTISPRHELFVSIPTSRVAVRVSTTSEGFYRCKLAVITAKRANQNSGELNRRVYRNAAQSQADRLARRAGPR
jgi:hypothetical protein